MVVLPSEAMIPQYHIVNGIKGSASTSGNDTTVPLVSMVPVAPHTQQGTSGTSGPMAWSHGNHGVMALLVPKVPVMPGYLATMVPGNKRTLGAKGATGTTCNLAPWLPRCHGPCNL